MNFYTSELYYYGQKFLPDYKFNNSGIITTIEEGKKKESLVISTLHVVDYVINQHTTIFFSFVKVKFHNF